MYKAITSRSLLRVLTRSNFQIVSTTRVLYTPTIAKEPIRYYYCSTATMSGEGKNGKEVPKVFSKGNTAVITGGASGIVSVIYFPMLAAVILKTRHA